MEEIKAVILAAGKGTRMKSLKPKVLHEIFAKPLLGWVLDSVSDLPFKNESIAVIGHGAHEVEEYLNKNYKYVKSTVQKQQLGTGHAVSQAVPLLGDYRGNVLILCGDTPLLTTKTLTDLINFHNSEKSDLTVMTTIFDEPFGYGRIIRNSENEVLKIVEEKDATSAQKEIKEVNAGVYCVNWLKIKKAFSELKNNNSQGEYYLTDIIKWARGNNFKVSGYICPDNREIYGINSRQNLAIATKIMKDKKNDELMSQGVTLVDADTIYISPETQIGCNTIIFPNTYIEGKNIIAKNCKIGPMTRLRGNCEVGEGCKIGNFVELKNAKVAKNSNVCHLSYIGDAEIGSNVNIGAGTIFANYNSITKEKKKSKLHNGVSIGSNSVIVAPVEIKENAFIGALSCITKEAPKKKLKIGLKIKRRKFK